MARTDKAVLTEVVARKDGEEGKYHTMCLERELGMRYALGRRCSSCRWEGSICKGSQTQMT